MSERQVLEQTRRTCIEDTVACSETVLQDRSSNDFWGRTSASCNLSVDDLRVHSSVSRAASKFLTCNGVEMKTLVHEKNLNVLEIDLFLWCSHEYERARQGSFLSPALYLEKRTHRSRPALLSIFPPFPAPCFAPYTPVTCSHRSVIRYGRTFIASS